MARLRIDAGDLQNALVHNQGEWLLDLHTGDVVMKQWARELARGGPDPADAEWAPDREDLLDDDFEELDPERFRHIDSIGSHVGFRWMERFAAAQDGDVVRGRLLDALERRRPFRSFKDALAEFPAVRDAWFQYEESRLREEALDWLQSQGLDAELVNRYAPAAPPAAADAGRAPFRETDAAAHDAHPRKGAGR